jgi:hypothetical protein
MASDRRLSQELAAAASTPYDNEDLVELANLSFYALPNAASSLPTGASYRLP